MNIKRKFGNLIRFLAPKGLWFGVGVAAVGSYQQAYENGASAIWSTAYGFPIVHHYVLGFLILATSVLIMEWHRERERA